MCCFNQLKRHIANAIRVNEKARITAPKIGVAEVAGVIEVNIRVLTIDVLGQPAAESGLGEPTRSVFVFCLLFKIMMRTKQAINNPTKPINVQNQKYVDF